MSTTKNEIAVEVGFRKGDVAGVEEGTISVRGEAGRWAHAGWYADLLRFEGRIYLHASISEAVGVHYGPVRHAVGAIRYGRGRASSTYVPISEEQILNLADTTRGWEPRNERELDRTVAIAAFAYALIDHLPAKPAPVLPPAPARSVPVSVLLGGRS